MLTTINVNNANNKHIANIYLLANCMNLIAYSLFLIRKKWLVCLASLALIS